MPNESEISNSSQVHSLAGKTAMVTGSSSGIGRAIAIELARRGADIIVHGRTSSQGIESVQNQITQLGRKSYAVYADFFQAPDFESLVDQAWNFQDKIDFWINNAGGDVLTGNWPDRSLTDKLEFLWRVDVSATLLLSRLIGQKMVEQHRKNNSENGKSAILNMGWDQALQGMAGESGELFSTTKGAIMAMTKSLAQSLAPAVRVNCLAPGWIKTQWGDNASNYWYDRAENESLMNRWGLPEDVANVAAFLCSEDANFVSGQIVPINGGYRFCSNRQ